MRLVRGRCGGRASAARSPAASSSTPSTAREVPVYVADYVLTGYGTGAIMAVPAEDERDFAFATVHGLDVVRTVAVPDGFDEATSGAWTGDGAKVNSGFLDGLDVDARSPRRRGSWSARPTATATVNYRLRDWLRLAAAVLGLSHPGRVLPGLTASSPCRSTSSRSLAPDDVTMDAVGSLAARDEPLVPRDDLPACGGPAERETDTLDTFVDSSWYFLRFCGLPDAALPFDRRRRQRRGCPSGQYIGGHRARDPAPAVHEVLHAGAHRHGVRTGARARAGSRLFTQGMIRMDGKKMSKSKGNLITPQKYFATSGLTPFGCSTFQAGPPAEAFDWTDQTDRVIEGCRRFLDQLWRLATDTRADAGGAAHRRGRRAAQARAPDHPLGHRGPRRVAASTPRSPGSGAAHRHRPVGRLDRTAGTATSSTRRSTTLLALLAPMVPHVAAELWQRRRPGARRRARVALADRRPGAARPSRPRRSSSRSTAR